ncbi:hypothetical protein N7526_002269 [Penicillium atrosanguineum]|nr:hypothetical protein N7526_002269 [Penicillium atrosanguineum]
MTCPNWPHRQTSEVSSAKKVSAMEVTGSDGILIRIANPSSPKGYHYPNPQQPGRGTYTCNGYDGKIVN